MVTEVIMNTYQYLGKRPLKRRDVDSIVKNKLYRDGQHPHAASPCFGQGPEKKETRLSSRAACFEMGGDPGNSI